MRRAILIAASLVAACGSDSKQPPPTMFGGDRAVQLTLPDGFDPANTYPLIVVLHGYGASGFVQTAYFGMTEIPQAGEAFLLAPDGLVDSTGKQFWNADAACCDFDHKNPDDVGYIGGLIEDVSAAWPVNISKVWLVGHSNGGYMAYRMACDRPDLVTNIVVLAGGASSNPSSCRGAPPVAVLHLHGTMDQLVPYDPVANTSVTQWAGFDRCATTQTADQAMDLESSIAGAETQTKTFDDCPPGIAVELWSITGGSHIPNLTSSFASLIFDYLQAHPRLAPD